MYITKATDFDSNAAKAIVTKSLSLQSIGSRTKTLHRSDNLFHEGDDACSVYEVVSGVFRLSKVFENGQRQIVAFGYRGDIVGFPRNGTYHTECDALTPSSVIAHSAKHLTSADLNPTLHNRLFVAAMNEITAMQDHSFMLGSKTASQKVASFLCQMMKQVGKPLGGHTQFEFPMIRADIADYLSVTLETVSRTIHQFKAQGVLTLESAKSVIVLKPQALQALAEVE